MQIDPYFHRTWKQHPQSYNFRSRRYRDSASGRIHRQVSHHVQTRVQCMLTVSMRAFRTYQNAYAIHICSRSLLIFTTQLLRIEVRNFQSRNQILELKFLPLPISSQHMPSRFFEGQSQYGDPETDHHSRSRTTSHSHHHGHSHSHSKSRTRKHSTSQPTEHNKLRSAFTISSI